MHFSSSLIAGRQPGATPRGAFPLKSATFAACLLLVLSQTPVTAQPTLGPAPGTPMPVAPPQPGAGPAPVSTFAPAAPAQAQAPGAAQNAEPAYAPPPVMQGQTQREFERSRRAGAEAPPSMQARSPAVQAMLDGRHPTSAPSTPAAASRSATASPGAAPEPAHDAPGEDYGWVLAPENRPWTLHFVPTTAPGALVISIPTSREVRLMLPGTLADSAQRARQLISRYMADAISSVSQSRARQLATFSQWVDNAARQGQRASVEPWQEYQFSVEARLEVVKFRDQVLKQSEPLVNQVQQEVNRWVAPVTAAMNISPSYDLQMAWYDVLVSLRDAFALYQAQLRQADATLLDALDVFLAEHPPALRPTAPLPEKRTDGFSGPVAVPMKPAVAQAPTLAPLQESPRATGAADERDTARVRAAPINIAPDDKPTSWGPGLAVAALLFSLLGWMFMRMRSARRKVPTIE